MAWRGGRGGSRRGGGRGRSSALAGAGYDRQSSSHHWPRATDDEIELHSQDVAGRAVVVGELHHHSTEEKISEYFRQFGEVVEVNLPRFPLSRLSRRKAFITFLDEQAANEVLNSEKGRKQLHVVDGTRVFVQRYLLRKDTRWVPNMLQVTVDTAAHPMFGASQTDTYRVITRQVEARLSELCGDQRVGAHLKPSDETDLRVFTVRFSGVPDKAYERLLLLGRGRLVADKYPITAVKRQRAFVHDEARRRERPERRLTPQQEYENAALTRLVTHGDMDFFEGEVHLHCDTEEHLLEMPDGVNHICRISFDNCFRPHFVCIIAPHNLPSCQAEDVEYSPSWMYCPIDVAIRWLQLMFCKGEEVVEWCKRLTSEKGIQDQRYCDFNYTLTFNVGSFQVSKRWLGHIVFPAHAYFLYRLKWYERGCHSQRTALSGAAVVEPEAQVTCSHVSEDTEASPPCPCPLASASHPDVKTPAVCRWHAKEKWAEYRKKNSAVVAKTIKELEDKHGHQSESWTPQADDPQEMVGAAPCEGQLNSSMSADSRLVLPLARPFTMAIAGVEMKLTMDKENGRNPILTVELPQCMSLKSADQNQLRQVIDATRQLCKHMQLADFKLSFWPGNDISVMMRDADFCRCLTREDAVAWESLTWKKVPGPPFFALEDLDEFPPDI